MSSERRSQRLRKALDSSVEVRENQSLDEVTKIEKMNGKSTISSKRAKQVDCKALVSARTPPASRKTKKTEMDSASSEVDLTEKQHFDVEMEAGEVEMDIKAPSTEKTEMETASLKGKRKKPEPKAAHSEKVKKDSEATPVKKPKNLEPKAAPAKQEEEMELESDCRFLGEPIPAEQAREKWPLRYSKNSRKNANTETEGEVLRARCHYFKAEIDECRYDLYDDAYVKADDGKSNYIGRIVEFFEATNGKLYFTAQWFYKPEDTVIAFHADIHDQRRVFLSDIRDVNPLGCIMSKLNIVRVAPKVDLEEKEKSIPQCDFYYDSAYSLPYSSFVNLQSETAPSCSDPSSTVSSETVAACANGDIRSESDDSSLDQRCQRSEMTLLDLYSGCGGMSTGLCLGANLSGVNLVTRWALDVNEYACKSLKHNHPETEVRNESADDFLDLLKEWKKLCESFSLVGTKKSPHKNSRTFNEENNEYIDVGSPVPKGEFEVGKIIGICYGDPNNFNKRGLMFKVRWKGYGPSEDTWEPVEGLKKCGERIKDFVISAYKSNVLPLPGDVDVICGGPPCQGISGFNRFRNPKAPLEDQKNHQLVVFMDIVEFLKPKYVLMENVVDMLKFAEGYLGRYAISRIVSLNYQARLGMMAAGCYGLPQFRMRVFLWGAQPSQRLPQFPLPTHNVIVRGGVPNEFERNVVAFDEDQPCQLEEALLLGDAISDLPHVTNDETRDEMPYGRPPETEFQKYIRLSKHEMVGSVGCGYKALLKPILFDHRPYKCNEDDHQRVCHIPKKKGANFRDLPGVLVGPNNVVEWDPNVERVLLPSGKPLVPDYAMSFVNGKSTKPFGRLCWDETVPTVVTRAEPHNQAILHPNQDRVLSIRENARLQGFPDYYRLYGPVKERYKQVGNAVAVPVARALGYALGMAIQGDGTDEPLMTLPKKFPQHQQQAEDGDTL